MSGAGQQGAIEGADLLGRRRLRIRTARGVITSVEDVGPARSGPRIAPGLMDLQVNGANGYDINGGSLTEEVILALDGYLASHGVTSFLPAVTTNPPERIHTALTLIGRTLAHHPGATGIAGVHLEGPFISPEDGPRGAHNARYVRPPDWDLFERWQEAAGGLIRIVTLSPEWPDACTFVKRAVASGVRVAIGHTAATPAQVREAVEAGASLSTHLGNGCHVHLPRHDNYLWEQLACDALTATLIPDGRHLPDAVMRVFLRAKGERAVLISDASALAGRPPGDYTTGAGREVRLTTDGRLVMRANTALLAGSVQLLPHGISHLVCAGISDLETAWAMASRRPASLLDVPTSAGIAEGAPADLVVFDWNDKIDVRQVYRRGHRLYPTDWADMR